MTDKTTDKRDLTVQIRISSREKQMIEELRDENPNFNISREFRKFLHDYYQKNISEKGIGNFEIG